MTLFGLESLQMQPSEVRSSAWALIQHAWCLYKKGSLDTRTQEEDDVAEDSRDRAATTEHRSLQGLLQAERTPSQHLQGEHGLANA